MSVRQVTAVAAHTSAYPNPISFAPGDRVALGRRDTEFPGWLWVVLRSGNAGWAPEVYLDVVSPTQAIATCGYSARELDTRVGERLTLHAELAGWLWVENREGELGWIPRRTTDVR